MRDRVQCRNPRARSVRSFACLLHVSAPQRLPQGAVVCCTGGVYETFYRLLRRIAIGSTDQTTKTTERRVVFTEHTECNHNTRGRWSVFSGCVANHCASRVRHHCLVLVVFFFNRTGVGREILIRIRNRVPELSPFDWQKRV